MNIPNILTVTRFLLVPVFAYFLYMEQYLVSILLFTIGGITDILDGYIARKYNLITSFGKLADPLADKLMQITALILLTVQGIVPTPFIIIVLAKETFMALGSITLYKKENTIVQANWYGKLATVIFYFAIVISIIFNLGKIDIPYTGVIIDIFMGLAVFSTLFAFFMYSMKYRQIRNDSR